jgi:hypothetical protein
MQTNQHFHPDHEPFREHKSLQLDEGYTHGPFSFLNPTRAQFRHEQDTSNAGPSSNTAASTSTSEEEKPGIGEQPATDVRFLWRSRDNRKGRHTLLVQDAVPGKDAQYITPQHTSKPREVLRNIIKMFTYFPYWDISWLVAVIFTLGSAVWVINAFFAFMPFVAPSTDFSGEVLYGGGITAFIGAIVFFETGSILLIFEAVNENNAGCFGWAIEQLGEDGRTRIRPETKHCIHHHQNRKNFVGHSSSNTLDEHKPANENTKDGKTWQWFPSWNSLKTHYFHELGFLAGLAQLTGATIFGISGFTALPGIQNAIPSQRVLNGVYWIPQMVGGSGFIVSGTLYMLETQKNWYTPAFKVLGWHIAFWNFIGALGFTLCGALGPAYGNSGAQYEASLATFWGSWAFLIGSVLQWYESLDKHPVESMTDQTKQEMQQDSQKQ